MKRHEVEWADGVVTPLVDMKQRATYSGLLEGIPTREINDRFYIQPLLIHKSNDGQSLLLWAPQKQVEGWPETFMRSPTASLPSVTCVATFKHFMPARDKEQHFSDVTVAWFQEEWALPIIPEVVAKIKSLEWRDVAFDYDW